MHALLFAWALAAQAQELVVQPFLQEASPTAVWVVWETDAGDESVVEWGATEALGQSTSGTAREGKDGSRLHDVHLTGLTPGSRVHYRVRTGEATSPIRAFTPPALASAEAPFTLVAVSDMQRSAADPEKWGEIVTDGIVATLADGDVDRLDSEIAFVMVAGDLVESGHDYPQWAEHFFAPAAELFSRVPVYPVPGNHEDDTPYFFSYFHLPDNGSPGFEEHWWWLDHGNVRVVGLDSNGAYWSTTQQDWLFDTLTDACTDPDIDFVFAQLHHPHHSELWTPGNSPFTATIITLLEEFTADCGKPSVHFFGHTHGYSRGASGEHRHLMVNVATAGGAIDRWGEHPQQDYPEYTVSTDDWGFVAVDVTAGDDPSFALTRYTRGNRDALVENAVADTVVIRRDDQPPATPVPSGARGEGIAADCFTLRGGPFVDPDGDAHGASEWQIARTCGDFSEPLWSAWRQDRNVYHGVDRQAGDDLEDEVLTRAVSNGAFCWRVRYRDAGLTWSAWSEPVPFTVGGFRHTQNLFGDDDLGRPLADAHAQTLPIGLHADAIAAGAHAWFKARLLGPDDDTPTALLVFRDADGAETGRAEPTFMRSDAGFLAHHDHLVPVGTRAIDVRVTTATGTFLDALSLTLGPPEPIDCDPAPAHVETPPTGCGCGGGTPTPLWILAAAAVLRRRASPPRADPA